jgi:hypothetical protein
MRKGEVGIAGRQRGQARGSLLGPRTPPTEAAHSIAQRRCGRLHRRDYLRRKGSHTGLYLPGSERPKSPYERRGYVKAGRRKQSAPSSKARTREPKIMPGRGVPQLCQPRVFYLPLFAGVLGKERSANFISIISPSQGFRRSLARIGLVKWQDLARPRKGKCAWPRTVSPSTRMSLNDRAFLSTAITVDSATAIRPGRRRP